MKKVLVFLICLLIASPAFAGKKPKKSPLLKLPKQLQYEYSVDKEGNVKKKKIKDSPVGEIITFEAGDAVAFTNLLDGSFNNKKITVTAHLTFPPGDGPFPVLLFAHSSSGPSEFTYEGDQSDYWWFLRIGQNLLDMGIAVAYMDDFSGRGCKNTFRDQSCASIYGQAIDAFEFFKVLKNNPKVNSKKIGITGSSRGGMVSTLVVDKKIRDVFLNEDEQFAASMPISGECRGGSYFANPTPTNTKILVVHGELDDYTLPGPCMDYAKRMKAAGGDVKSLLVPGAYHSFFGQWKAEFDKRIQTFNSCPFVIEMQDDGNFNEDFLQYTVDRVKDWNTIDDFKAAIKADPAGTWEKGFKKGLADKKKGCVTYGAHEGGDWGWQGKGKPFIPMSESKNVKYFTPIFLNFWKDNLL